jgi:hypothetical protein
MTATGRSGAWGEGACGTTRHRIFDSHVCQKEEWLNLPALALP